MLAGQHPVDSFNQSSGQIGFGPYFSLVFEVLLIFVFVSGMPSGVMSGHHKGIFEKIVALLIEPGGAFLAGAIACDRRQPGVADQVFECSEMGNGEDFTHNDLGQDNAETRRT